MLIINNAETWVCGLNLLLNTSWCSFIEVYLDWSNPHSRLRFGWDYLVIDRSLPSCFPLRTLTFLQCAFSSWKTIVTFWSAKKKVFVCCPTSLHLLVSRLVAKSQDGDGVRVQTEADYVPVGSEQWDCITSSIANMERLIQAASKLYFMLWNTVISKILRYRNIYMI